MNQSPLVSVVVPCLNRANFLIPTIESILNQDYAHVECIVVDGGSTDGTLDILHSYGDHICWVSEPDEGHADAINKGWKMSRGEILAWLNADDLYVTPSAISQAVYHFTQNPDVDLIYGNYARLSEKGEAISKVLTPRPWDLIYAVKYCYFSLPQPASFMKRAILEEVNWLDTEIRNGKDHELWLRIGLVGQVKYVPAFFAYIRDVPGLTQRLDMSDAKVEITRKFFNLPNLPAPFTEPSFQRRAYSNSHLIASTQSLYNWRNLLRNKQLPLSGWLPFFQSSFKHLLQAVTTDPLNLFHILMRTTVDIAYISLPYRLQLAILNSKLRLLNPDNFLSHFFKRGASS